MSYNKMFTDPQDGLKLGAFQKLLFFSKNYLKLWRKILHTYPFILYVYAIALRFV